VSILALMVLSYVLGAAVLHFNLPTSDYLQKAFIGARAWRERRAFSGSAPVSVSASPGVRVDEAEKTYDGFTLYTTTQGARATLIDMRGNVVHQWELPFGRAWPRADHVASPVPEERIHWFRCHLYPNGDLLAVYHAVGDTPYGYGLAKLDKSSNLVWAYAGNVHHDVDVGEDGTIYALTHQLVRRPPAGLGFVPGPYIADALVILSPEGEKLDTVGLLEAFRDSPHALALASIAEGPAPLGAVPPDGPLPRGVSRLAGPTPLPSIGEKGNVLHANSVKVLSRALAPKFPMFKPGQVLTSLRSLDTLAVLDPSARAVVWAARGLWRAQHDAEFLENGHLLVYDNLGSLKGTRILEYHPLTQAVPWAYANENATPFLALVRGTKQRLPNGNTLIVDPDSGRIFEVTRSKELVWECSLFAPESHGPPGYDPAITSARRYGPGELSFLKRRPRPGPD
jgi:hypothetical protein